MPAWLLAVLRVVGIRRAADVVPVATRLGEVIADALDPDDPSQPLSHKDVETIARQRDAATSHKVPNRSAATPPGGTLIIKAAPSPPRPPRKKGK